MGGSRPPFPLAPRGPPARGDCLPAWGAPAPHGPWPSPRTPLGSPLKPPVGAARAGGVAVADGQRRVPVEDDRVVEIADQHGVAWLGAGVREGLLNAEPGQPVSQVADRLVVAEVRLPHPALRLLAADQVGAVRRARYL